MSTITTTMYRDVTPKPSHDTTIPSIRSSMYTLTPTAAAASRSPLNPRVIPDTTAIPISHPFPSIPTLLDPKPIILPPISTLSHPASASALPAETSPREPDPLQAINNLDYLSRLTAYERAELYRRTRTRVQDSSSTNASPSGTGGGAGTAGGWLSYLPSLLSLTRADPDPVSSPASVQALSAAHEDILAALARERHELARERQELAREKQENSKLKSVIEQMRKQLRDVCDRCCILEGRLGASSAKGESRRGVKRRRDVEVKGDAKKRVKTPPVSPAIPSCVSPPPPPAPVPAPAEQPQSRPQPRTKHIRASPPRPRPRSHPEPNHLTSRSPSSSSSETLLPPALTHSASAQVPITALPANARKYHPAYASYCSSTSTSTRSATGSSTRVCEEDESDTESLPTPAYPSFISEPTTPQNRRTNLECPPSPPKRVKSAEGRIQIQRRAVPVERPSKQRKARSHAPTPTALPNPSPDPRRVIRALPPRGTPSPSATPVPFTGRKFRILRADDELTDEEIAILGLMYRNDGMEVVCRACRIFTSFPHTHPKHLLHPPRSFVPGTAHRELYMHCVMYHPDEWEDLEGMKEEERRALSVRLGEKDRVEKEKEPEARGDHVSATASASATGSEGAREGKESGKGKGLFPPCHILSTAPIPTMRERIMRLEVPQSRNLKATAKRPRQTEILAASYRQRPAKDRGMTIGGMGMEKEGMVQVSATA